MNENTAYHVPQGRVLWLTGLSGAGKSTIAAMLQERLLAQGIQALILDGDQVRSAINDPHWQYDLESRLKGSYRYSKLALIAANQGHTVIVPTISMFHEVQKWNKDNIPGYFEVYLKVSEEVRKIRDPKVLYQGYQAGNNQDMAGLDLRVEEPLAPNLIIENNGSVNSLTSVCDKILSAFISHSST